MSHGRNLKFLLTENDYDAFDPYAQGALWPYAASDPDHAIDRYLDELDKLSTSLLRSTIVSSDIAENDEIYSADLRV